MQLMIDNNQAMITYQTTRSIEDLHDFTIIDQILEGDQSMFAELIRRNNASLYKAGRGYHYSHEDTQDIMQDSYIDAYMNLSKFEKRSSFRTWLLRIMINNCHKRKQKRLYTNEVSNEINEDATPLFAHTRFDTQHMILHNELNDIISRALLDVPEDYRLTFTLREIAGLSVKETAEVLDITETNVKVRLNRAKAMLRKKLELSYNPQEIFEFNLVYCDAMANNVMQKINNITSNENVARLT